MSESQSIEAWLEIVDSWKKSGLSQSEFCRKSKVRPSAFFYWRRRIEDGASKSKKEKSKNLSSSKKQGAKEADFVEVEIPPVVLRGRVIRLTTSYGATIELPL